MAANNLPPMGADQRLRLPALFLIGAGLVILGVVAGLALWRPTSAEPGGPNAGAVPIKTSFLAPDLALKDLNGQDSSLEQHLGGYVLVNNWATWCPPCRAEMPVLQAFFEEHRTQGFSLIAIDAGDPPDQVRDFVEQYGLTFAVWLDPEERAIEAFRNQALPSSYLIDPAGRVILVWNGAIERENLERIITPLLEQHSSN